MTLDPARLHRALFLDAERIGDGLWSVRGGAAPHSVTPDACDCYDFTMHPDADCKHRLAVRLSALDAELLDGLRALVPA